MNEISVFASLTLGLCAYSLLWYAYTGPTWGFICAAIKARRAYIDVDGTLVEGFKFPADGPTITRLTPLEYWRYFLPALPLVKKRLPLLYLLRALGVKLILWTNRGDGERLVTLESLGGYVGLFTDLQFHNGTKRAPLDGPTMDDQIKYACRPGDLLVESL